MNIQPFPGAYRHPAMLQQLPVSTQQWIQHGGRLAKTNAPMTGVTPEPQIAPFLAEQFDALDTPDARWYAAALRSGDVIPVSPTARHATAISGGHFAPGQLFFNS